MTAPGSGAGASVGQRAAGNMAIQRKMQTRGGDDHATPSLRAPSFASFGLRVSQPDDPSEHEADRVADDFVRGHQGAPAPIVQRKAARDDSSHSSAAGGAMAARIQRLEAGGHPLPVTTRAALESHTRADLGDVRIHTDGEAAGLASGLNAKAFTKEQHIAFASGEYQPHSREGQHLIAHEVAHTLQRRGANSIARQPDAPETPPGPEPPAPEPPAPHPAEEAYTSALHIWHLRSGMGEAITDEDEKILENEDINQRIAEEACGPDPLQVADPSSLVAPGLTDASLLYSYGPEEEPTFLELLTADDDLIALSHAYAYRVYLQLLQTGPDAFADEPDFWSFHDEITARACSEKETLEQLGNDAIAKTWVFPRTWAKKLESEFIPDITMSMLDSWRVTRCAEVGTTAQKIAPWLAKQGLPIGFRESLTLSGVSADDLERLLRQSTESAGMMDAFFKAEEGCLDATFEYNFAKRWLGWGNEIVHAVGTAHKYVNYASATTYWRQGSVGWLISNRRATGEFRAESLRLEALEKDISHMAYVNASVSKWLQSLVLQDILHRQFSFADQMIQGLGGERRLELAGDWREAKEFDSAARSFLWEQFDLGDVATSVGLDILANIGIGLLTGGWGVLAKEVVQGGLSAAESAERISDARKQAKQASSVADLQRAAANLSVVMQADGLNIALTIAQIPGLAKQAKKLTASAKVSVPDADLPGVKKPAVEPPPKTATAPPTEDVPAVKTPVTDAPSAPKTPDAGPPSKVTDRPDVAQTPQPKVEVNPRVAQLAKETAEDAVKFTEKAATAGKEAKDALMGRSGGAQVVLPSAALVLARTFLTPAGKLFARTYYLIRSRRLQSFGAFVRRAEAAGEIPKFSTMSAAEQKVIKDTFTEAFRAIGNGESLYANQIWSRLSKRARNTLGRDTVDIATADGRARDMSTDDIVKALEAEAVPQGRVTPVIEPTRYLPPHPIRGQTQAIVSQGRIGNPPRLRPGGEGKYPLGKDVGLPGHDRYHLEGVMTVGDELNIVYATADFNRKVTAAIEKEIRGLQGDLYFEFSANCRIVGDVQGVTIKVVESITWKVQRRVLGTDTFDVIVQQTARP